MGIVTIWSGLADVSTKNAIDQLQETIKALPINDRWFLLKWLIELLHSQQQTTSKQPETMNQYPDARFYGCIQDDTLPSAGSGGLLNPKN